MECTHATLTHTPLLFEWKGDTGHKRRRDTFLTHPHMRDTIAMFFLNWHYMDMIRVMIGLYWDDDLTRDCDTELKMGLYWDNVLGYRDKKMGM